jgi:hypothetical protein
LLDAEVGPFAGLANTYEAAHARLALECLAVAHRRFQPLDQQQLAPLANPVSQAAADQLYFDTARKLAYGLNQLLAADEVSLEAQKRAIGRLWVQSGAGQTKTQ